MTDCQLVLRFFALEKDEYINGSMRAVLDRCMERHLDVDKPVAAALEARYNERLELADRLFDGRPFALDFEKGRRHRPLAGLYDAVMVSLDRLWAHRGELEAKKVAVQAAYRELIEQHGHTGALTGAANTSNDIKMRIKLLEDMFRGQLG